ncbi:MAG: hypothetical protein AB7V77_00895 [Candidatus Woesearchaeota archaeon]
MAKKNDVRYWVFVVVLTLGLFVFQTVISWLNKLLPFMNQLYFFMLCLGSALYLAKKI